MKERLGTRERRGSPPPSTFGVVKGGKVQKRVEIVVAGVILDIKKLEKTT